MKNDLLYIILIITLSLIILFYGGVNYHKKIEYESSFFDNYQKIILYESKINKYNIPQNYNNDFVDLSKFEKISDSLIPNLQHVFFLNIKSNNIFNINNIITDDINKYIMIIFNFNKNLNIELLLKIEKNNTGLFYKLNKITTITNVYNIYNPNQTNYTVCVFFIKKSFWYY